VDALVVICLVEVIDRSFQYFNVLIVVFALVVLGIGGDLIVLLFVIDVDA
jgi:hypothetical protein